MADGAFKLIYTSGVKFKFGVSDQKGQPRMGTLRAIEGPAARLEMTPPKPHVRSAGRAGRRAQAVMYIRDTSRGYGIVSRLFHWVMAVAIFGMFALGLWMVRLDYYSPYYNSAPDFHRSFGILLLIALLARWLWRATNPKPDADGLTPFEHKVSYAVHWGFYVLLLGLMISGYLISTPDGAPIDVFGWFNVPSIIQMKGLEDQAGYVHRLVAYGVIALAVVHSVAALKHHFIDRSEILSRMWSGPSGPTANPKEENH
jgi:cytochrome b561